MSVSTQKDNPVARLRSQLQSMGPQFKDALPSHIKPEKFQRVVMTVAQQLPDLLAADRQTLLTACMKCAADGLVPDGREAALVIFNTKKKIDGQDRWVKAVQYMPMMIGILKRARNSGQIAGIIVNVVHENDEFVQTPDDFDHPLKHRPPKLGEKRGRPIGAYALAKLRDGTIIPEVMDWDEIERVKAVSRSRDKDGNPTGPWKDWPDQMARKTVLRRLSKYLPMDAAPELEKMIERDEEADSGPTLEGHIESSTPSIEAPSKLDALDNLADPGAIEGEIMEDDEVTVTDPEADQANAYRRQFADCKTLAEVTALSNNPAVRRKMAEWKKSRGELFKSVDDLVAERLLDLEPAPVANAPENVP